MALVLLSFCPVKVTWQKHFQKRKIPWAHPFCSCDQCQPTFPFTLSQSLRAIVLCPSLWIRTCFQVPEESTSTHGLPKVRVLKVFYKAWKTFRTVGRDNKKQDETHSLHSLGPECTKKLCSFSPFLGFWPPVLQASSYTVPLQAGVRLLWKTTWNNSTRPFPTSRGSCLWTRALGLCLSYLVVLPVLIHLVDPDPGRGGRGVPYHPWNQSGPGADTQVLLAAVHLPCLPNTRTGNLSSHTGTHHKWVMILSCRPSSLIRIDPRQNSSLHKPPYIFSRTGASWRLDRCLLEDTNREPYQSKITENLISPSFFLKSLDSSCQHYILTSYFLSLQFSVQHKVIWEHRNPLWGSEMVKALLDHLFQSRSLSPSFHLLESYPAICLQLKSQFLTGS